MEQSIFILILPLLSFLVLALAGKKMPHQLAGTIGTLSLAATAILACATAAEYFAVGRNGAAQFTDIMPYNIAWLPLNGTLSIDMGVLLSPISAMMLIVITVISLMVHIYSLG